VAASVVEYGTPGDPPASAEVVMLSGVMMVIDKLAVAVPLALSFNVTVKEEAPAVVGVPLIVPLEAIKVRPAGNEPALIDQV
jgi:hypothetical protein